MVFFGFMFVCSLCSIRAKADVSNWSPPALPFESYRWQGSTASTCRSERGRCAGAVSFAGKLATDARDQQPLFAVGEKTGSPIRKTAVHDGIAAPVWRLWRDPEAEWAVVTEAFQPLLVHTELSFGELVAQRRDYAGFEMGD